MRPACVCAAGVNLFEPTPPPPPPLVSLVVPRWPSGKTNMGAKGGADLQAARGSQASLEAARA